MSREPPLRLQDVALWRKSRGLDSRPDEAARYLDLAAFADGRLDPDERERVAEWLANDAVAAADVAAAQALAGWDARRGEVPAAVLDRAAALVASAVPGSGGNVVPFRRRGWARSELSVMARWGSLAAGLAVASWLGFTLGVDTSRSFAPAGQAAEEGFLPEILDSPAGFVPDLTEGRPT